MDSDMVLEKKLQLSEEVRFHLLMSVFEKLLQPTDDDEEADVKEAA